MKTYTDQTRDQYIPDAPSRNASQSRSTASGSRPARATACGSRRVWSMAFFRPRRIDRTARHIRSWAARTRPRRGRADRRAGVLPSGPAVGSACDQVGGPHSQRGFGPPAAPAAPASRPLVRRGHTTTADHMPSGHRRYGNWTPGGLIAAGERIGPSTAAFFQAVIAARPHPDHAALGSEPISPK
jgi:hypothetical protein